MFKEFAINVNSTSLFQSVAMTGTIKLFQSLKKYFKCMRIELPTDKSIQKCTFKPKNLLFLLIFVHVFLSSITFLLFKAKSAYDYGFSFYISVTEMLAITIYLSIICFKIGDIVTLIQKNEEFIEMSKRIYISFRRIKFKVTNAQFVFL